MKSKPFVWILAAVLLTTPAFTAAQEPTKGYRIGYITPHLTINNTFRQRLRELGYIEGQNLVIELRSAPGKRERFRELAAELVRLKVDLILGVGSYATRVAKEATTTIPIVMGSSTEDPIRYGLVASLARPGGNVTGLVDMMSELAGKQLELLKETFPNLSRVAYLYPKPAREIDHIKNAKAAAPALGIQLQVLEVDGPDDLEDAFQAAVDGGAEALIVVGVGPFTPQQQRIIDLEIKSGLPAMHTIGNKWARRGGLMSCHTDSAARYRRAAEFVDMILKGKKPADLPVERPAKFEFVINLKTAGHLASQFRGRCCYARTR